MQRSPTTPTTKTKATPLQPPVPPKPRKRLSGWDELAFAGDPLMGDSPAKKVTSITKRLRRQKAKAKAPQCKKIRSGKDGGDYRGYKNVTPFRTTYGRRWSLPNKDKEKPLLVHIVVDAVVLPSTVVESGYVNVAVRASGDVNVAVAITRGNYGGRGNV